jgi:trk system potassium uptake protein TrkH
MATGGFSTYNSSMAHFQRLPEVNAVGIEWVTVGFMLLAAINFTLLYLTLWGKWRALRDDIELRYFLGIWLLAALVVGGVGWWLNEPDFRNVTAGARHACFTVASVLTTTGYATVDFDQWNNISRSWLLALMFIGGCSGSTGGGLKVIRHVLLLKILRIEIEHAFHPRVVRLLRLGGKALDDQDLRSGILVYFALVSVIFVAGWLALVAIEPVTTWGADPGNKLVDSASAVAATLNNVGPGIGVVGPSQNFQNFCGLSKILFTGLMMLGRLELFPVLVLFMPQFWKDQ